MSAVIIKIKNNYFYKKTWNTPNSCVSKWYYTQFCQQNVVPHSQKKFIPENEYLLPVPNNSNLMTFTKIITMLPALTYCHAAEIWYEVSNYKHNPII